MDLDMPQTEVNEEVYFDITPAGSLLPERRLIYRLVGNPRLTAGNHATSSRERRMSCKNGTAV